jgi:phospholipid/cholesterol/gamma-HCH transport system substrate-binding protein
MSRPKKRNDVTTEIVVGAFMFSILVILLTVTVVISQNKLFEKSYTLISSFPNVGGLKEGEPVFLRGVRVGNVERIEMDDENAGVLVRMRLRQDFELYEDYELYVEASSMLGGMRLIVDEGSHHLAKIPKSDYEDLVGSPPKDILAEATKTIEMIRESLVEGGTLENISTLAKNMADMSEQINSGEGTIGRLIHDQSLYDDAEDLVAELAKASTDFKGIAQDIKAITGRLEEGKGSLGKLLSEDEQLFDDVSETMSSVNKITGSLAEGKGTLGKLLSGEEELYDDLRDALAALKTFSQNLAEQEGTLARLINDEALYLKVVSLVDEARATIDDFRETSPITTFSSIFFGAF